MKGITLVTIPAVSSRHSALIVDDNLYNREICRIILKHAGYEVAEAENGEEALQILDQQQFDLLILDLLMPVTDGSTVFQEVYQDERHTNMAIIIATTYASLINVH